MSPFPNVVYLEVAGFLFQVNFEKATFSMKEDIQKNTIKYFGNFIVPASLRKPDFQINIIQAEEFLFRKLDNSFLIELYHAETKKRITTYYQVGPIYFFLIIKKVLIQLLGGKGFMMHSSSSLVKGKAAIFLGPPEAGKSTIVRLLHDKFPVLNDEESVIKIEKKLINLYQTPLIEDNPHIVKQKEGYPVSRFCFLKKADYFRVEKIHDRNLVLKLFLKQVYVNEEQRSEQAKTILDFVSRFDNFYTLYFAKDSRKLIGFIENNFD